MTRNVVWPWILLLAGCGGGPSGPAPIPAASVTLTAPATVRAGTKAKLSVKLLDAHGNAIPADRRPTVAFGSSDPSIATVDDGGHVHALRVGTVTFSAVASDVAATVVVPVRSGWIKGALGTVYLFPTSIIGGSRGPDTNEPWDTADNTWWIRSFDSFAASRDKDLSLLHKNFDDHARIQLYIYFPAWLADPTYNDEYVDRLDQVVDWFYTHGIEPVIFFGRPEYQAPGFGADSADVTYDPAATKYLLDNIDHTLGYGHIPDDVYLVTVYYAGQQIPPNGRVRSSAEILAFNEAIAKTIHAHGMKFLVHVDQPFWDCAPSWATSFCGKPPSGESWWEHGYTPEDIAASAGASDGLFAESRLQGSLVPGLQYLVNHKLFTPDQLLILNDTWNCDLPNQPHCVSGPTAIDKDDAQWFTSVKRVGIASWGVWDFTDGGAGEPNPGGDVKGDGSGLTHKGELHAAEAAKW